MTTFVTLGNKEHPSGSIGVVELTRRLKRASPPYVFLNDLVDPLAYENFGMVLRSLDSPYVLCTSLVGFPGYRALKANGIGGDRTFIANCSMIHAFHVSPRDGGNLSLAQFLERLKHLVSARYPITLYVPEGVNMQSVPYALRSWISQAGMAVVGKWKNWPVGTSGRYGDNSCEGEHTVVGAKGTLHPCIVAAGGSFGRGVYAQAFSTNGDIRHEGRDKCSLRGCPNNEQDSERFGSYRFVQTLGDSGGDAG